MALVTLLFACLTINALPTHIAFAFVLGLLIITGCVDEKGALQGFNNKGANTVAILYIVAFAVTRTNGMAFVFRIFLGDKPLPLSMVLLRICIPLGGLSMFLNNTPIYQAAVPELLRYATAHDIAPTKLLMPVAIAIILGGTMSLIGTSTNLVVSGLAEKDTKLRDSAGNPLKFTIFGLTRIGALYFAVGLLYVCVVSTTRLLPSRRKVKVTGSKEYLVHLRVTARASTIIGRTVADAGLRNLTGLYLVDICRGEASIPAPGPDTVLLEGDVLTFCGNVATVTQLFQKDGGLLPADLNTPFTSRLENSLYEAVVSPDSLELVGRSVRDIGFRDRFDAAIVAISHRGGPVQATRLGDVVLQPGDSLILEGTKTFAKVHAASNHFSLVYPISGSAPPMDDKFHLIFSMLVVSGMISLAAAGKYDIWIMAICAAIVLTSSGCMSLQDATSAIDIPVMLTIVFAFGVGGAIQQTKVSDALANLIVGWLKPLGPLGILFAIYITVGLLTEVRACNAQPRRAHAR
jgi:di/tricarboxylate transporter